MERFHRGTDRDRPVRCILLRSRNYLIKKISFSTTEAVAARQPPIFVKRKPRDSRVVEKRLTGERKSSKYVIIEETCQSKLKNIFGGFIYEKSDHRQ